MYTGATDHGDLLISCRLFPPGHTGRTGVPGRSGGRGLHPHDQRYPLRGAKAPPGAAAGGEGHATAQPCVVGTSYI